MSEFTLYFNEGIGHILTIEGYDHILFVVALCSIYASKDWKKVLILVTAFTIGHSITLALASFEVIRVDRNITEFFIAATLFVTALSNILKKGALVHLTKAQVNYTYAVLFGLIHGLGFSSGFRSLLGKNFSVVNQLLAFNLGIELGQIVIVIVSMTLSFIVIHILNVNRREWNLILSSAIMGIAVMLMIERIFW
ncbi:HupE/UreJ family protein [Fulvivirgaceae bacterium BMA10]|uniref:HupE/UreJ family protein n=1 Tax=Splendidivirga corallicola TaxID=3051826 RepID=A0ABT8KM49_9BACT|nr:HupE/UreJ family protein [Fulvivirgaceae bacterium BMA10]